MSNITHSLHQEVELISKISLVRAVRTRNALRDKSPRGRLDLGSSMVQFDSGYPDCLFLAHSSNGFRTIPFQGINALGFDSRMSHYLKNLDNMIIKNCNKCTD